MKKYIFFVTWALIWGFVIKTIRDDYMESKRIAKEGEELRKETDRLIEQFQKDAQDYVEIDRTIQRLLSNGNISEAMRYGLKILQRENEANRRFYLNIVN